MISRLSQKITIKRAVIPENHGFEQVNENETEVLSTWAAVKEVSRQSLVAQGLNVETLTYKVLIRYNHDRSIRKGDFVVWNGKKYRVYTSPSIKEIDKKRFLEFLIVGEDG
jgi:SPP1 family predicted phage head-tail adaptor